jgi:mannose-1-phosphate guanylyltransferase/mannose-6-phosphate isomerase
MLNLIPVVLAGGTGSRLWPLSRAGFPKQFLVLSGTDSLFQAAAKQARRVALEGATIAETLVVMNEDHRFLALEQLREIKDSSATMLLEPASRDTGAALTLAALQASGTGADPVMVVIPADLSVDGESFSKAVEEGVQAAAAGAVVMSAAQPGQDEQAAGPLVVRASVWLDLVRATAPAMAQAVESAWAGRTEDGRFVRPQRESSGLAAGTAEALVRAAEAAGLVHVRLLPLVAQSSGLDAWDAVWQGGEKTGDGNVVTGDVLSIDTRDSLIHASSRLVGTVGVENLVVVETADAVLVADRASSHQVAQLVAQMNSSQREEHLLHRKVHRPWGWYDSIDEDLRFKVKRILVNPGASLSLQMHHHRAEHWIVVRGTAEVTCGDKLVLLCENQSTYIPLGEVHRLRNPGTIPLEIIEVQSGSYLGEDDIVRLEDTYGRAK